MRTRLVLALVASTSWAVMLASCGSDSVPVTSTDGGSDDARPGVVVDAGNHPSSLDGATGCPATTPGEMTPCPLPALQCEYGAFDLSDCNSMATCTTKGWSIAPPPVDVCAPNSTKCPSTSATIQNGDACEADLTCFYADITCACNAKGNPDAGRVWSCDDATAECPAPRPHLGAPCTAEGQICDWASCGKGGTSVKNIQQRCKGGVWQFAFATCDGG